jgi:hypothetical protein
MAESVAAATTNQDLREFFVFDPNDKQFKKLFSVAVPVPIDEIPAGLRTDSRVKSSLMLRAFEPGLVYVLPSDGGKVGVAVVDVMSLGLTGHVAWEKNNVGELSMFFCPQAKVGREGLGAGLAPSTLSWPIPRKIFHMVWALPFNVEEFYRGTLSASVASAPHLFAYRSGHRDRVYHLPLPNINSGFSLCTGKLFNEAVTFSSLQEYALTAFNQWQANSWNTDLFSSDKQEKLKRLIRWDASGNALHPSAFDETLFNGSTTSFNEVAPGLNASELSAVMQIFDDQVAKG